MTHYNIFQPNFGILLLLKGSSWKFRFYCLDQKLVCTVIGIVQCTHLINGLYVSQAALIGLYSLRLKLTYEDTETFDWYYLFITKVDILNFYMLSVDHFEDAGSVEVTIIRELSAKYLSWRHGWYGVRVILT